MILLQKVTKRFGPKILFENVSMQFDPAKRYGLTGANGAGKSTLLKMLAGQEDTDTGSIEIPGSLRLGVLKQNHFEYDQNRIIDTVLMGNKALWAAMAEKDRLLADEVTDEIGIRLGELEGVIAEENGYVAESEAASLLEGLGIATGGAGNPRHLGTMTTLPAGYKLRVLIAQVLFGKSDVLLLDEPTNHLDLDSIRWLEHFLIEEFRGTLVCVSHDRHFLNSVATHIADVDYRTITIYTGAYDDFIAQKYENRQRAEQQQQAAKKKIGELQDFVQRFGAHKSKSSQAQSRLKQIGKLEEEMETRGPKKSSLVRPFIRFEFDKPSGRDVLRVTDMKKAYDKLVIFAGASLTVNRGDKIAVTGPNGVGKSTLLKCLVGGFQGLDADAKKETLIASAGEIQWGHDVSVGYFAQDHHESLGAHAGEQNAFEWLYQFDKNAPQEHIRGIMGRLLFQGDSALKPVSALSGGELARLLLCKLLLQKHNVLVLDEPTNHLDIESIEGLLDGLRLFKGTVIVTSHDRHFVSELATRVLELQRKGDHTELNDFGGTYEEFLERQQKS